MDWEANLAAVIKCTDANLEQQFRQFEDVTAEFTASPSDPSENVAATYLRESMATDYRQQQQQQREKTPTPSYSRVSSSFARGPATSAPATSFSEHFHRRQERKRGAMKDNQRAEHERQEYGQMPSRNVDERRYAPPAGVYQMYASPTYDVAQMMEQVRLSLKLEVDARAAIAERQLSALLQLCKATSEELDRLRVEVCANDRQLHTIDQVQSKLRQELTTQKDIGFHLQSMCGKDESWRMQTENQLLELRQMVAALREQGNSTQAAAQEKLSRSELLVQFNAAMEPIKAQLQANLQHQAQQIADITRTTSSSSLLLDGITQKVNRGITEEISELRSDLNALKHHVAKMDIFQDPRGQQQDRTSKEELDAQKKKEQQQEEKKMNELREGLLKDVMAQANEYVDSQINLIRQVIDESSAKFIDKKEVERLKGALEEECGKRCAAVVAHVESQMKSSQDIIRDEVKAAIVSAADRMDMSMKQATSTMTTALNGQSSSLQNKLHDVNKVIDKEQKERKQALDELHEALRKNRHNLEDQIHTLTQENRNLTQETRTKLSQHGYELERHVKEMESYMEKSIEHLKGLVTAQVDSKGVEWDHKFMRLEETIVNTNKAVNALSETVAATRSEIPSSDASSKDSSMALEKQTTAYLSTMESMLQKMQLQLQLQAQSQAQVAIAPTPYHGYWPPSPYPSSHPPPPPTLHLPPGVLSSTAPVPGQPPTTTLASSATNTGISPSAVQSDHRAVSNSQENGGNASNALKEKLANDNSAETLLDTFPVRLNSASAARNSTPPVVSQATPIPSLVQQVEVATSLQSAIDNEPNKGSSTDQSNKREGTIAATTKGALAEAELAKARVENRRKQEMETKQQLLQQRRPSLESAQLTKHQLAAVAEIGSRPATAPAPVVIAKRTPITEKAEDERPNIEGKNAPAPVVVAGNASSSVQSPSRQPPPQLTAKPREAAVPPSRVPVLTGAMVTTNSPMPKSMPSAVPVATARSVAVSQSLLERTHSDPNLSLSRPSAPSTVAQHEPSASMPPSPSAPASLPTKDEKAPPPSPLAKIFAQRPAIAEEETLQSENTLLARGQSLPIDNITPPSRTTVADNIPASATPSSISHVLCGMCRLPVRSDQKVEHEKTFCPKRNVECANCKQQMQWANLEMHELNCSSVNNRTTIPISAEVKPLTEANNASEFGDSLKKCRHCSADVPILELLEHEINCNKVLKQCPHCLRRQKMSELQEHIENCDCRLVSCPNDCGGKFLQRGIPNHLATRCPKKPVASAALVAPAPPQTAHPEANKTVASFAATLPSTTLSSAGKVECKFCDDEIDASKIETHEEDCDWRPKRCQHCNMVVISRDLVRHETSCKTNLKPCPHCNENMPPSTLTTHASRCSKRPIKCIRCCQLFSADAIVAHSTNCKFVPGTATPNSPIPHPQSPAPPGSPHVASRAPIKIPPPPPFPPPPSSPAPVPALQPTPHRASADPRLCMTASADNMKTTGDSASDRLARRNLALSQLTNPGTPAMSPSGLPGGRRSPNRASAPSMLAPSGRLGADTLVDNHDEEDEDYEDDEDDDQLTLAQVVKEWNVDNVCLWLSEDVGVPEVVSRFQQQQCNGEMLLELTESDLINDFGVKSRVHRERILNAIEAIQTSDAFSDDDEDFGDEEDEDGHDESEDNSSTQTRHSAGGASFSHPRDILRRSQPSPQRAIGGSLPSSNDMLRRITNALENPKR